MRCRSAAISGLLLAALIVGGEDAAPTREAWAGSWPGHRRQTDRTGWASEDAAPPLTQKWTAAGPAAAIASPVTWGGYLYAAFENGTVACYDRVTGALVWQTALGARLLATPLIAVGQIWQPTMDGRLVVLDAATGRKFWEMAYGEQNAASPLLLPDGRTLILVTGPSVQKVLALDIMTRAVVWQADLTQNAQSSPAWDGTRIVAAANDGTLRALTDGGNLLWTASGLGEVFFSVPAAFGGRVFVPSGNDTKARALEAQTGAAVSGADSGWSDGSLLGTVPIRTSSFALARGADGLNYAFVLLKSTVTRLYALDADNLAVVRWSVGLTPGPGDSFYPSPAVANDVVYVAGPDWDVPALFAYTVASGGALGSWPLDAPCLASPAVANGWVYVVTKAGTVYGFEAAQAVALTSPDTEQIVPPGRPVTLSAISKGVSPTSYTVETAPGRKMPDDSGFSVVATQPGSADAGNLGTWVPPSLGDYTVRLTVNDSAAGPRRAMAYVRVGRAPVSQYFRAATGGELVVTSRIKIVFPPNSLSRDGTVTGTLLDEAGLRGDLGGATPVKDTAVEVTLEPGLTLLSPATLVLGYDHAAASGLDARRIRVYWLDESSGAWKVVGTSRPDPAADQVTAEVPHFTKFRAMGYASGGPLFAPEEVYAVPNPARGDSVLVKFRLSGAADVTLKLYNVAGEQVEEITRTFGAADAGLPRSIAWDLRSVASGVYLYRLEAVSAARTDAVTKKLAVLH